MIGVLSHIYTMVGEHSNNKTGSAAACAAGCRRSRFFLRLFLFFPESTVDHFGNLNILDSDPR